MPNTFGERLKKLREGRELSQSDLGRLASMQPSAIAHFEADRRKPSFDNIRLLAKALEISTDTLLGTREPSTAFRNEDKLTTKDREIIQSVINNMVKKK